MIMLTEDKVRNILFRLNMLGFKEEYDEKKDNLKSYLKGRRDAFKDVLDGEQSKVREANIWKRS
jgi:hypothetical protein